MMIVNKGSSFGWSLEDLAASKDSLGLSIIQVLDGITTSWEKEDPEATSVIPKNTKGLIKEAYRGMYHDLHGLSVLIDMINHIYESKGSLTRHKDFLFVSEAVEKYFSNLRSIYDFLAKVSLLAVNPRFHGQISFDSLNTLIKNAENEKKKEKFPLELVEELLSIKPAFNSLKNIRDYITHNGKQLKIRTHIDGYHIENLENKETDEPYLPLLPLLSTLTMDMLSFSAEIAVIISNKYTEYYGEIPYPLIALNGICMPAFIDFLGLLEEDPND